MKNPTSKIRYVLMEIHQFDAYYDITGWLIGLTGTFLSEPHIPTGSFPPNFICVWFKPDNINLGKMYFKAARFEEVE